MSPAKAGTTVVGRFFEKVGARNSTGCEEWTASRTKRGYGQFKVRVNGKPVNRMAHRVAWELAFGAIPEGLCVLHTCDNPPCVRKHHLFLGTNADNSRDMVAKGRSAKGEQVGNARLSTAIVRAIRREAAVRGRAEIAAVHGVSRSTVARIINQTSWRHV